MKKLALAFVIFIILLSTVKENKSFSLLNYFSGEYAVYTSSATGKDCIDLGFCYVNSKPVTDCVVGESMVVNNLEVGDALKVLNAKVVKTEVLEDGTTVIYAFTNLIKEKVSVSSKYVNLQVATKDDRTVIGWPLILGSF